MLGLRKLLFCLALWPHLAVCLEPFAILATPMQPVWQAGLPTEVRVNYDVPAHSFNEAMSSFREADSVAEQVAEGEEKVEASLRGKTQ
ncbi:unnamed protein product [Effrenium voratum]|nr:unnamed protein product [Effrenium voratum]